MAGTRVIAVMSDLFFAVKILDAAKRLGLAVEIVSTEAAVLEKARTKPALMIFDLNCAAARPVETIAAIRANPETAGIPVIGFVSHVQVDVKQRALESGCDAVFARSAFERHLPEELGRAAGISVPAGNRD